MINNGRIAVVDTPENLKASITGSRVTEVSFAGDPNLEELSELPGVLEAYKLGGRFRLTTRGDDDIVGALVDYGRMKGFNITSVNTLKPTLEDAFIRITGSTPTPIENGKNGGHRE